MSLMQYRAGVPDLVNFIGDTVYPGLAEVPAETWMARAKSI
jgi:hypothetical protein